MSGESVKVVVRTRPLNQREKDLKSENIVIVDSQRNQVSLMCPEEPKIPPKQFTYDGAYAMDSNTEQLYNDVGFPLVESVCEGYNGTIFAYGQTGCGKSFTMQGTSTQKGIIPRAFEHIFECVASDTSKKYLIRASYLEIYNENIRDLIGKDTKVTLELHEHPEKGIYVTDLSWHECKKVSECEKLMEKGINNRATGSTLMNTDSSRSHAIFTLNVEQCERDESSGEEHYRAGKLNLVDLAGSERLAKSGAWTGARLKEATKINLSLSALGNVISALVDGKSTHIPYRDSMLTRLLQDSLGGNTKTLMIAVISPAADNYDETLSTLRYANRTKNIKNKPRINEDPKDAMLRQLQDEIRLLKEQLAGKVPIGSQLQNAGREQIELEKQKLKEEFEERMQSLKSQYEEEKMNKEALMKQMESIRLQYDNQMNSLEGGGGGGGSGGTRLKPPKSARPGTRKMSSNRSRLQQQQQQQQDASLNSESSDINFDALDPEQRLMKLQQMVVGGELANDEELKKKRIKKKKYAEERRKLAEALRKDDDDDFMLRVYDNVQEEIQYKTRQLEKEKQKAMFLKNEVEDLQREFEREREEYCDTIRKQERQLKLLLKLTQKIQPLIPSDCNYYNLDKIQSMAAWNEETQDWCLPELKREKLSLPTMMTREATSFDLNNNNNRSHAQNNNRKAVDYNTTSPGSGGGSGGDDVDFDLIDAHHQQLAAQHMMMNRRAAEFSQQQQQQPQQQLQQPNYIAREPPPTLLQPPPPPPTIEIDRYRVKLENSQFDGSSYFKTKRQSELLNQTQDLKNNPINNLRSSTSTTRKYY